MIKNNIQRWLFLSMIIGIGSVCAILANKLRHKTDFIYVDFDTSMNLAQHSDKLTPLWGKPIMQVCQTIYKLNNAQNITYDPNLRIPKIIHQIWLGGPLPEKYHDWQATWKKYHPDWEYHLWTDDDIERLHELKDFFVGNTYEFYQQATNYGERSDVLKILLIHYFGGMYVDTDFECLRSCEILHHYYDFYIGVQPLDVAYVQLGYALFAAYPQHPFIKKVIEELHISRKYGEIVRKTGPLMLTNCFARHALAMPHRMVALPATYFYPRNYNDPLEPRSWIRPESFAVHHWAGSWLAPEAVVKR